MGLLLYHSGLSTASGRVRLALAEKGQRYESRHLDLATAEHHSSEYLKVSPTGLVPALVHDGRVVWESSVINEYLDEALPGPALSPEDPWLRARMRLWVRRVDEGLHDPAIIVLTQGIGFRARHLARIAAGEDWNQRLRNFRSPLRRAAIREAVEGGPGSAPVVAALRAWQQLCTELEASLRPGGWVLGVQFGLADIAFIPYFARLAQLGLSEMWKPCPHVTDWWERAQARASYRPALHAWMDPADREALRQGGEAVREQVATVMRGL